MQAEAAKKGPLPKTSQAQSERREVARRIVHHRCYVMVTSGSSMVVSANESKIAEGYIIDISPRGAGLILEAPFELKKAVKILVEEDPKAPFDVSAMVVWCALLPSLGHIIKVRPDMVWRIGVRFLPASEEQAKALAQFAERI